MWYIYQTARFTLAYVTLKSSYWLWTTIQSGKQTYLEEFNSGTLLGRCWKCCCSKWWNNATQRSGNRYHLWAGPSHPQEPLTVLEPPCAAAEQDSPHKRPVKAADIKAAEREQSLVNATTGDASKTTMASFLSSFIPPSKQAHVLSIDRLSLKLRSPGRQENTVY